jgi:UrcA family protein
MKKSFYIALFSALLTAGLIKAVPAVAQTPAAQSEIAVSLVRTSDLNLGSVAGQRTLDLRIANAAREVCGAASDIDVAGKNDIRECRSEVIAKARLQKTALLASAQGRGATIAVTASR